VRIALLGTGVHPIPPTGYGGIERVLAEFADALRRAGQVVSIVQQVRKERSLDEYWFARHLNQLLSHTSYDVLHASTPVVAAQLAWSRRPYIYTTHSRHWFERSGVTEHWGYWLEKRAVRHSVATVALTERVRSQVTRVLGSSLPSSLPIIPIGVDLTRFQPDWSRRTGKRALGVGAILPVKRWEVAAQALKGTGFSLRIAGPLADPSYAAQLRTSGDPVELLGELSESQLIDEYAQSDLLVHPSRVELLPGAVVQGLAAGLPVLGAEPVRDLVIEDATGWVAPPGSDPSAIARFFRDRLARISQDQQRLRTMGEAARKSAERAFDWGRIAGAHVDLYTRILNTASASRA